jgi:glycerol-3-phosphate acyltransferase PlsY
MGIAAVVLGYFMGSIPFAVLLTRRRGIALRTVGSGNPGAANVLRTAGVGLATAVVVLDAAKGAVAVVVARLMDGNIVIATASGLAAIVGHAYPAWSGFRGGKGVAASAGAFAVLAPVATAVAALVFVGTTAMTRFVSAGSLAGAVALPFAAAVGDLPRPVVAGTFLASVIVIARHRGNVSRLLSGTERRIGLRS